MLVVSAISLSHEHLQNFRGCFQFTHRLTCLFQHSEDQAFTVGDNSHALGRLHNHDCAGIHQDQRQYSQKRADETESG